MNNKVSGSTNNLYDINPVPQHVIRYEGEVQITDCVHIVAPSDLKVATLPKLKEALAMNGYTYDVSDAFVEGKTNIYLSNQEQMNADSLANIHPDPISEMTHTEGYTLVINGDAFCNIAIIGHDSDGIHYGVVTLNHILSQLTDHIVQKCVITDYPEILYRGYIEGFYGFPWSHEDRMDLMTFGGKQKLNTFIYAPKDDPYHRKHWRNVYPAEKAQEIAELAVAGHANNLNFVWTIHPGDTIDLSSEEDYQAAIHKLEQLYTLGVRQFGILFDDLVGVPNGIEQATFINSIDTEFIKAKGDIRPLLTVGTRYCEAWGPSMTEYFKPFLETLHEDVEVMWTGAATMSNISKEQYDSPTREIGSDRNLSVWWNYPVNDYCDSKILMGKIENLSSDLNNVNGFFSNPMNQPQASKQALFCIADHNWNTDAFNCDTSFTASFKALAPEVAEDLEIFASNCCYLKDDGGVSGDFVFDESWYLRDDITKLKSGLEQGRDVSELVNTLRAQFTRMETAADRIQEQCLNVQLVKELDPFVDAFRIMAQSAQSVMDAVIALQTGDLLEMEHKNEVALSLYHSMEQCKVHRLKEEVPQDFTVDVGTFVIQPFIIDMITLTAITARTEQKALTLKYDMNNIALQSLGVTVTASSSVNDNESADKTIDGTINSGKWCSTEFRPHLTVDLQQPTTIKQYRIINCGHPLAKEAKILNTKHAQILASLDGEHFKLIDEVADNKGDVMNRVLLNEVTARYIRLQIVEPAQISIEGSGHTRIYAFELFDERYPDQSRKVLTSEIHIEKNGHITISNVNKGDVISLYRSLDEAAPFAVSAPISEDTDQIVFEGVALHESGDRIFVERTSGNYLPSVRTSKGI
ncbi:beta-N-acetylglucosaminidase domain-containing protein [Paenibacillus sp. CMAA1364]